MAKLKIGEVVILKSGGDRMTVVNGDDANAIVCNWFPVVSSVLDLPEGPRVVFEPHLRTATFPTKALERVSVEGEKEDSAGKDE